MKEWTRTPTLYPAGTPVYLWRAWRGEKGPRENATLLTPYMTGSAENMLASEHPVFETESGERLQGCECWWIPVERAEEIEEEVLT